MAQQVRPQGEGISPHLGEVAALGREITLQSDTTMTVGSDPSSHVRIEKDPTVEPNQVRLAATDQGVVACDMSQRRSTKVIIGKNEAKMVSSGAQVVPEGAIIEIGSDTFFRVTRNDEGAWGLKQIAKEEAINRNVEAEQDFQEGVIRLIQDIGIKVPVLRGDAEQSGAYAELRPMERIERALLHREPYEMCGFTHPILEETTEDVLPMVGNRVVLPDGEPVVVGTEGHIRPRGVSRGVSRKGLFITGTSEGVTAMNKGSLNKISVYIGGKPSELTKGLPFRIPNGAIIRLSRNILYRVLQNDDGQYELLELSPQFADAMENDTDRIVQQEEAIYWFGIVRLLESQGLHVPSWDNVKRTPLSPINRILRAIEEPRGMALSDDFQWPGMSAVAKETLQQKNEVVVCSEGSPTHNNHDSYCVVKHTDGSLDVVVMDGSGGGLDKDIDSLPQAARDALIRGVVKDMIDAASESLRHDGDLYNALQQGHEAGTRNDGYATAIAVKVGVPDQQWRRAIKGLNCGDCVVARFDPHRIFKTTTDGKNWELQETPHSELAHAQLVNKPHNLAWIRADLGLISMGEVENSPESTGIYRMVGDDVNKERDDFSLVLDPTELLIVASDGIRIGDLIGIDPETGEPYPYAIEIHQILMELCADPSPEKAKEAGDRIIKILRTDAGEDDDITIAIVLPLQSTPMTH